MGLPQRGIVMYYVPQAFDRREGQGAVRGDICEMVELQTVF